MTVNAIEVTGLTKRFGRIVAVEELSFAVREGTVTAFLGPNGSGKTTTLRTLLGLVEPSAGRATIGGRRYRELGQPIRRVGAVLESSGFHPSRRARDHLRVIGTAAGLPGSRVEEVLVQVGLAEVALSVDDVVIISRGRLVLQSPLDELARKASSAVQIRTPQPDALRGVLHAAGIATEAQEADGLVAVETTAEAVGVAAARAGVVIFEMSQERFDLEDVFLELTATGGATR